MVQGEEDVKLTPALCRAARGLLDWTQAELAQRAAISRSTVRDFEGGRHDIHRATAAQLTRTFREMGVGLARLPEGTGVFLSVPAAGSLPAGPAPEDGPE